VNYIRKHWRGELSLGVSFWINTILFNILHGFVLEVWTAAPLIENPVTYAQLTFIYVVLSSLSITPWQFVGLWRACNRHVKESGKTFWGGTVQVIVILMFIGVVATLVQTLPFYKDLFRTGFGQDKFANYKVELKNNATVIHVQGQLGFGVSEKVEKILNASPNVKGIILDSSGGWTYEGRELSRLILDHGLDTYSLKGCYSSCVTAFIAGKTRLFGLGASLAFHRYRGVGNSSERDEFIEQEESLDLEMYRKQGVKEEFLSSLFSNPHEDFWYPTTEELLNANVIHGVVNDSVILPVKKTNRLEFNDLKKGLLGVSAFKSIQRYEPKIWEQILNDINKEIEKGSSQLEMQHLVVKHMTDIVQKMTSKSSDEALIRLNKILITSLNELVEIEPVLCSRYLFPDQYGLINLGKFVKKDTMGALLDALSDIIVDAYEKKVPPIDIPAAEFVIQEVNLKLGRDVEYLEFKGLRYKADHKKACNAMISLFELILLEERESAGNVLRYIASLS